MLRTARHAGYEAPRQTRADRPCGGAPHVCHNGATASRAHGATAHEGRIR